MDLSFAAAEQSSSCDVRRAILTELHYGLLRSRHDEALPRLALPSSYHQRITRAVEVIRREYPRSLPVEQLAIATSRA